jgi:homoaconitate hydratase
MDARRTSSPADSRMSLTLIEKIATRYAVGLGPGESARQGQIVRIRPKHVMTHDNTGAVIPKFQEIVGKQPSPAPPGGRGSESDARSSALGTRHSIFDPHQPVFAIDHDIQNRSPENLGKYARIEKFAAEHGIDFYPAGTGISHQVMVEQGYVVPGSMVVGSDSHSNLYGAACCLGTPVVRTDAACIWATGQTWWLVPPAARCVLKGRLRRGVAGKDVIIALCGLFNHDEVLNHAIEFAGDGVACLSMDQRMSIANMTTEWGALAGVFPFDEVLCEYLLGRAAYFAGGRRPGTRRPGSLGAYTRDDVERWWRTDDGAGLPRAGDGCRLRADEDASYAIELELDLSTVIPHASGPNEVKVMTSLPEMERRRVPIQKAYLLSCVNARLEDLAEAAAVVRGRKVAPGVEFYVAAASAEVQRDAERLGWWGDLVGAGAIPLPSGCGPCIGLGKGLVEAGETAISATNRNFKGRMGDPNGQVYLGSPAVVAASAVAGYICAPERFEETTARIRIRRNGGRDARPADELRRGASAIIGGFPRVIRGRVLYLPRDNMNTDGIYAGKWTYKDDLTPEQMAGVTFENYDPAFNAIYRRGDIVASGRNFGTGSSREQAATALKHKGVPCVIAASFSETYKRNAFNNGFLCIDCPALVDDLGATLKSLSPGGAGEEGSPLTIPGPGIEIDFAASLIRVDGREFAFDPLSPVAQELVVAGGAEALARRMLAERA